MDGYRKRQRKKDKKESVDAVSPSALPDGEVTPVIHYTMGGIAIDTEP